MGGNEVPASQGAWLLSAAILDSSHKILLLRQTANWVLIEGLTDMGFAIWGGVP
jgi:hypothetical protein